MGARGLEDLYFKVFKIWEPDRLIPDRLGGNNLFGSKSGRIYRLEKPSN